MNQKVADENYISLICNGEFNAIPDFKIGELFESFFDNINYNVIKENDKVFVDFTGEAICDDEPCEVIMRFRVEDNIEDFEVEFVKVNEDILSECEVLDLLEDIAYVGGATMEEEICEGCTEDDCSHCGFEVNLDELENDENKEDEE